MLAGLSTIWSLISSKIGLRRHSAAVNLNTGLYSRRPLRISRRPSEVRGKKSLKFTLDFLVLKDLWYLSTDSWVMNAVSSSSWCPRRSKISFSWSPDETMLTSWFYDSFISLQGDIGKQLVPPNRNLFDMFFVLYVHATISARMHPMAHMSAGKPYIFSTKITSGGLYHLEITWEDSSLFLLSLLALSSRYSLPILALLWF